MKYRFSLLVCFLSLCSLPAFSVTPQEALAISNWDKAMMRLKLNGMLAQATSSAPSGGTTANTFGNAILSPSTVGTNELSLRTKGNLTAGGKPLTVDVEAKVLKNSAVGVSGALGRFLGKTIPLLNVGVALYDLAKELDIDASKNPDGTPAFTRTTTSLEFQWQIQNYGSATDWGATALGVCTSTRSGITYPSGPVNITYRAGTVGQVGWQVNCGFNNIYAQAVASRTVGGPTTVVSNADFVTEALNSPLFGTSPNVPKLVRDVIASGEAISLETPSAAGPATTPGPVTTTTNPDGSTSTATTTNHFTYAGDNISHSQTTVTQTCVAAGSCSTTTTTTEAPTPTAQQEIITCGLPNTPACKIDETGTPETVKEDAYKAQADAYKAAVDAGRETVSGTADKPFFQGWSSLFFAPAMVACVPYTLPNFKDVSMGVVDPCPVVEGVRTVMSYIWALTALFMCLGMVRRVI